ncbi:hypothetical protein N7460_000890 [Penicillium canescens]|uniref:Uncharacterized protein n=1 Tax=Penicillium canescens TaxID=5083 RepID=A0AAD6INH6_PENCN|nr:hypothetical protein N7460_000890 [Penicillium canescens]
MVAAIVEDRDVHEAMGLLGPTLKLDTDEFTINEAKAQALMDAFFPKMADAQEEPPITPEQEIPWNPIS